MAHIPGLLAAHLLRRHPLLQHPMEVETVITAQFPNGDTIVFPAKLSLLQRQDLGDYLRPPSHFLQVFGHSTGSILYTPKHTEPDPSVYNPQRTEQVYQHCK
jgi:hypothetical protein